jgi:hypothetical protein
MHFIYKFLIVLIIGFSIGALIGEGIVRLIKSSELTIEQTVCIDYYQYHILNTGQAIFVIDEFGNKQRCLPNGD